MHGIGGGDGSQGRYGDRTGSEKIEFQQETSWMGLIVPPEETIPAAICGNDPPVWAPTTMIMAHKK